MDPVASSEAEMPPVTASPSPTDHDPKPAPKATSDLAGGGHISDIEWGEGVRMALSGLCIGTADLVPGVSGGTMAVALGIYRRLLAAITSLNRESVGALLSLRLKDALAIVHWRFLACLGVGVLGALIIMGKIVGLPQLVVTNPKPVYAIFFGLVLASGVLLIRRVGQWRPTRAVALVVGTALGFAIVRLVPVQTPENPLFIFLCGAIAITAMILPGISGSFMLLVLGKYEFVIGTVVGFLSAPSLGALFGVIIPFALGCLVGITSFSRLLNYLLDTWHDTMLACLTGLLLGSLWRIWPYQHVQLAMVRGKEKVIAAEPFWPESIELWVVGLVVLGLVAVFFVEWLAQLRSADRVKA